MNTTRYDSKSQLKIGKRQGQSFRLPSSFGSGIVLSLNLNEVNMVSGKIFRFIKVLYNVMESAFQPAINISD